MTFYSPLRYPGGKNCIFKFVSKLFKENNLYGFQYAEPYAGGAGLALRLLFEEHVEHIHINDLDRSIFAFWDVAIKNSDSFCDWIQDVEINIENWNYYRSIQKSPQNIPNEELAKSTFFLNRTNVSGVLKGGVIGGQKQLGKYKIDARFNKDDLISRIQKISKFKSRITTSNLDGIQFIQNIDQSSNDVFIYLDPPYYQKGAGLYMNFYSEQDHLELSKYVYKMKNKWMVSYDNHNFILNLYDNSKKFKYRLSQSTSNRVGDEVLIFSDQVAFTDSMQNLKEAVII